MTETRPAGAPRSDTPPPVTPPRVTAPPVITPAAAPLPVRLDRRTRILRRGAAVRVLGGDPVSVVTPAPRLAPLLDGGPVISTGTVEGAALARALTDRGMAHPVVAAAESSAGRAAEPSARSLKGVAVVVPVKDDAAGVAALAKALEPERARGLRLVVVDDGSTTTLDAATLDAASLGAATVTPDITAPDTTPPHTRDTGAAPVILRHDRPRGPAAARNAGTAAAVAAGAEVVVYLDADVLPLPGWLDPLLAHLDDPVVAAVAPRIVAADPGRFGVRGYETARSALDMGPAPARVRPRTRVPYVPSAALAVRPGRLPDPPADGGAGPFDERLHVAEDVDLCWRIDAAGGRVRYEPAARVSHRHRTDLLPLLTRRAFYGRGAAPLARRHGSAVAPAVASTWSLAVAAGVWSATPVGLAVAGLAAGRAWWRTRRLLGDARAAAELVGRGAGASVRQLPEALLRPYWPVTAAVLVTTARSRSPLARGLRRRVVIAAVVDGLWHWWVAREPGSVPVDEPAGHVLLKRLDDLAYGVGVWRSAWTARSAAALRPDLTR